MIDETQNSVSSPIHILLVEDNEHDQTAFKRALGKSPTDFDITVCDKAEDAFDKLSVNQDSFDLIIVDFDLPGMTGLDFYRRQQHLKNQPPFVMLTGAGSENLAVEALQAGMYDYIIKDPGRGYLKLLPLKLVDVTQRKNERRARRQAQAQLKKAHDELEKRVAARTAELSLTIQALESEILEHQKARKQISIAYDALNSTASGIIITDADLRIRFANPACLRLFDYDAPRDIIGLDAADLFSAEKFKKFAGAKLILQQSLGHDPGAYRPVRRRPVISGGNRIFRSSRQRRGRRRQNGLADRHQRAQKNGGGPAGFREPAAEAFAQNIGCPGK